MGKIHPLVIVLAFAFAAVLFALPVQEVRNSSVSATDRIKENPHQAKVDRKTVGLALGSGGARGLAHIGVIKALEKHNIPIDYIAGSSSGALVGGLYAATFNVPYLEEIVGSASWQHFVFLADPNFGSGVVAGNKLKSFIEEHVGDTTFDELGIPLVVMTTDLRTGESVQINKGGVADAIRASISLPFVFNPLERESQLLLDGGLTEPVPVQAVREMGADIVIAVNLDAQNVSLGLQDDTPGLYTTTIRSLDILRHHLAQENVKDADIVLVPDTGRVAWYEFIENGELIQAGEVAVEEHLDEIRLQLE